MPGVHRLHGQKRQGTVHHLILRQKGNRDPRTLIIPKLQGKINAFVRFKENFTHIPGQPDAGTAKKVGPIPDDFRRFRTAGVVNHRHAGLDNPRFFPGDFPDGISQVFRVIQADGRNHHRDGTLHRIRGVQAAPKASLQDTVFHLCALKQHHSRGKQKLEIRGMREAVPHHLPYRRVHLFIRFQKILVRYVPLVNPEPLVDLHQMRGGKQTCPLSGLMQHGSQKGAYRPFSICSRHMDNFHSALRMSQTVHKFPGIRRLILLCKFRNTVNVFHCFCIVQSFHHFCVFSGCLRIFHYYNIADGLCKHIFSQNPSGKVTVQPPVRAYAARTLVKP